jgi:hypothetical protein
VDFAINIQFSYSSRDELGVLRAEIKDEDLFCHAQR